MGLFDLFRNSKWEKLKAFPPGVQQDIACLVALDSLIKAAVADAIQRLQIEGKADTSSVASRLRKALTQQPIACELHLAILATGDGKEFPAPMGYLPPYRAVSCLGIVAMCGFRNDEQLRAEDALKLSGYSADPDVARTQLLVLMANHIDVEELDQVRVFDSEVFRDFWVKLRKTIFADIQLNVVSEQPGLSLAIKERFEKLSDSRKEIFLLLAESLSKKKSNEEAAKVTPKPFNLAQSQKEHPFKYVPYPKLINVMRGVTPRVLNFFKQLSIDEYELRRIIGAESGVSEILLTELLGLDANTAAYCIVVAAVMRREPDFVGCGVWKKLTEAYQSKNMRQLALVSQAIASGKIGDARVKLESNDPRRASLLVNLITKIRGCPGEYIKGEGNALSRLKALLAGTTVLRHVLNHPRYGKSLGKFVIDTFISIDPLLDDIKGGELLTWDQQKNLSV
jgi:hypothetical protein